MAEFDFASLSDDELMDALGRAIAAVDPMPPSVIHAAVAAFELRNLDGELLTLLSDSLVDAPALVRGPTATEPAVRELTLAAADGSIEVAVSIETDGPLRHLYGQVVVATGVTLVVHTSDGAREVPIDASGLFAVRDLPARNVRLEFRSAQRAFHAVLGL